MCNRGLIIPSHPELVVAWPQFSLVSGTDDAQLLVSGVNGRADLSRMVIGASAAAQDAGLSPSAGPNFVDEVGIVALTLPTGSAIYRGGEAAAAGASFRAPADGLSPVYLNASSALTLTLRQDSTAAAQGMAAAPWRDGDESGDGIVCATTDDLELSRLQNGSCGPRLQPLQAPGGYGLTDGSLLQYLGPAGGSAVIPTGVDTVINITAPDGGVALLAGMEITSSCEITGTVDGPANVHALGVREIFPTPLATSLFRGGPANTRLAPASMWHPLSLRRPMLRAVRLAQNNTIPITVRHDRGINVRVRLRIPWLSDTPAFTTKGGWIAAAGAPRSVSVIVPRDIRQPQPQQQQPRPTELPAPQSSGIVRLR